MNSVESCSPNAPTSSTVSCRTDKSESSRHPPEQTAASPKVPSDTVELSDKSEEGNVSGDATSSVGNGFADFDMEAFQAEMRQKLLDMVKEAKKAAKDAGVEFDAKWSDEILYSVPEETKAAEVPEYWNAENTSQRIVDYSMSFRSLAPDLSDEEYITTIRDATIAGFKEAKGILGDLPGSVGKLFNDTYNLTMKRFDELLQKAREAGSAPTEPPETVAV